MDVPKLLEAASLLVPEDMATEHDITVADVWEYLTHDEWEVALDLLEELGDIQPLPLSFWETLATAAEQMRLEKSAAWLPLALLRNPQRHHPGPPRPPPGRRGQTADAHLRRRGPATDVEHRKPNPDRRTGPQHRHALG